MPKLLLRQHTLYCLGISIRHAAWIACPLSHPALSFCLLSAPSLQVCHLRTKDAAKRGPPGGVAETGGNGRRACSSAQAPRFGCSPEPDPGFPAAAAFCRHTSEPGPLHQSLAWSEAGAFRRHTSEPGSLRSLDWSEAGALINHKCHYSRSAMQQVSASKKVWIVWMLVMDAVRPVRLLFP